MSSVLPCNAEETGRSRQEEMGDVGWTKASAWCKVPVATVARKKMGSRKAMLLM